MQTQNNRTITIPRSAAKQLASLVRQDVKQYIESNPKAFAEFVKAQGKIKAASAS